MDDDGSQNAAEAPSGARLRTIRLESGERYPLLLDADGQPHWYATLFITTQLRNAAKATNTSATALAAIQLLIRWESENNVTLRTRFAAGKFLDSYEIESLRDTLAARLRDASSQNVVVLRKRMAVRGRIRSGTPVVGSETLYIRMTYVAKYLAWLANTFVERQARSSGSYAEGASRMVDAINRRRPRTRGRSITQGRMGLVIAHQRRLLEIVESDSPENPFSQAVRNRNELIVHLLLKLGLRAGELLALKVDEIDFQDHSVLIARRHDDPEDPRRIQPVAKTLDRRLPLSRELATMIHDYVSGDRRGFARARLHKFLLVSHAGGSSGSPLSIKALGKMFETLRDSTDELPGDLSPHVLRHTWNDRFSELMDELGKAGPDEEKARSYAMGWREGSGTASVYTRRHTEAKAKEASLLLQQSLGNIRRKR